ELAEDHSRAARDIARGEVAAEVFPHLATGRRPGRGEVDKVALWRTPDGGSYQAVGVGGGLTGHRAHVLGIADPFRGPPVADPEARRRAVWAWYTSTAYTRLAPGGGVVVMATRWHEDDLTGRLLLEAEHGRGDQWELVSYAAIAEADEEHRKAGEALHPER